MVVADKEARRKPAGTMNHLRELRKISSAICLAMSVTERATVSNADVSSNIFVFTIEYDHTSQGQRLDKVRLEP